MSIVKKAVKLRAVAKVDKSSAEVTAPSLSLKTGS